MAKSLYIHIPFCNRICTYCDFNKVLIKNQPVDEYIDALITELSQISIRNFKTIFVGGGTPTALTLEQLEKLLNYITTKFYVEDEFTFEANPDELTKEKLKTLQLYGVNRLSLGIQSFNDDILKILGRTHQTQDIYTLIDILHTMNFENYSIDLMYNLPKETMADINESLRHIESFKPKHVSWYSLIIEPHTVFYNKMKKGHLNIGNNLDEQKIYTYIINSLNQLNYPQYEISNFAKREFESMHNKTYWHNDEYIGTGAGSHGYFEGVRYSNIKPINHYIKAMKSGDAIREQHTLTLNEKIEEEVFLNLRMNRGLNLDQFQKKYHVRAEELFKNVIEKHILNGQLLLKNNHLKLSDDGRMHGNDVLSDFLLDL